MTKIQADRYFLQTQKIYGVIVNECCEVLNPLCVTHPED